MGLVSLPTVFVDGTIPTAAQFNGDFNALANEFNGNITNANISASAAIATTKINATFPSGAILGTTDTQTLTNKRITKRVGTTTSHATPTIDTDDYDIYILTAQAEAISSFTTNLSGTPTNGQGLIISITDNGTARAITWGDSFESSGNVTLPTTTVISTRLDVGFLWNSVTSKWRCIAVA